MRVGIMCYCSYLPLYILGLSVQKIFLEEKRVKKKGRDRERKEVRESGEVGGR